VNVKSKILNDRVASGERAPFIRRRSSGSTEENSSRLHPQVSVCFSRPFLNPTIVQVRDQQYPGTGVMGEVVQFREKQSSPDKRKWGVDEGAGAWGVFFTQSCC